MKYRILQLPVSNPAKFMGLDFVKKHTGIPGIEEYVNVYSGTEDGYLDMDTDDVLSDIWYRLNMEMPADYHAHSLSVSDVVGLNVDNRCWEWYYVDSIGFKRIWRA